ncbi:hypothetical protein BROUX41_005477 [Berkeleyomyces rouxiae]|uniref:uncharacterized protein n=1 Tax=Berkeleyomyces rouxiae TaxID=2035830 RepID=UPI003B7D6DCD
MAQSTPAPPPLLLTKRITSSLARSLSAHIHTVLLCSPAGKLLAHVSSPLRPVAELRTQATVAASLISLYASSGNKLAPALSRDGDDIADVPSDASDTTEHATYPYTTSHSNNHIGNNPVPSPGAGLGPNPGNTATHALPERSNGPRPKTITVQLTGGAVVVRELACGLLFVCVGAATPATAADDTTHLSLSSLSFHNNHTAAGTSTATALVQPAAVPARNTTTPGANNRPGPAHHAHASGPGTSNDNGVSAAPSAASAGSVGLLSTGSGAASGADTGPDPPAHGSGLLLAGGLGARVPDAADEVDSVLSAGAMTTASVASTASAVAVVGMKRAVEESARRLDAKLAALCVPDEGVFE